MQETANTFPIWALATFVLCFGALTAMVIIALSLVSIAISYLL